MAEDEGEVRPPNVTVEGDEVREEEPVRGEVVEPVRLDVPTLEAVEEPALEVVMPERGPEELLPLLTLEDEEAEADLDELFDDPTLELEPEVPALDEDPLLTELEDAMLRGAVGVVFLTEEEREEELLEEEDLLRDEDEELLEEDDVLREEEDFSDEPPCRLCA